MVGPHNRRPATGGVDCYNSGGGATLTSEGYNIDSDGSCLLASGTCGAAPVLKNSNDIPCQLQVDIALVALADNGGPTQTHALTGDSVAIDAGATTCYVAHGSTPLTADQRGEPRPMDGDGDSTAKCDVGAFELSPYVLQHSKCYKVDKKGSSFNFDSPFVYLQDQFDAEPVLTKIKRPASFCNPADKNGEGIMDDTLHMTCYDIDAEEKQTSDEKHTVYVDNQFGNTQKMNLLTPNRLCIPSAKDDVVADLDRMDHFKCYKLDQKKGKRAPSYPGFPIEVTLEDQFDSSGPVDYIVERPNAYCNPVDKDGEGIIEPEGLLACYTVNEAEKVPYKPIVIESDNQLFEDQQLKLLEPNTLCVPSIESD